ncbi:MAG: hypothetical protein AAFX06_04405 [Planctomycetota bacterium]
MPFRIAIACLIGMGLSYGWAYAAPSTAASLVLATFQVAMVSIVIWQACDPFADAAQFFGERWRIPGSVRGATLDAIASSLPELFTGLFFVVLALGMGRDASDDAIANSGDGFGATIATCAGSAVYNMILIPAFCGIAIAKTRHSKPVIEIERNVITRDGFWFLACEIVLIGFLFQKQLSWHLAAILLCMYVAYLVWLALDARRYRLARATVVEQLGGGGEIDDDQIAETLRAAGISTSPSLIENVRNELNVGDEDDGEAPTAGVFFGWFDVALTAPKGYVILFISTLVTAVACYALVEITLNIAEALAVPVFFVAVIVAAAASSVPDTFLSIAAAKRGDDDGAVSNAFGSNIFDICVCLSIPLLVGVYFNGGEPIDLTVGGKPMIGLFGLQVLLFSLTTVTLGALWHKRQLTIGKSYFLVALYFVFIAYAVIGSLSN